MIRNAIFIGLTFLPFIFVLAVDSQRTFVCADPRSSCTEDMYSHPIFQFLEEPTEQLSNVFYAPANFVLSTIPNSWVQIAQRLFPKFLWTTIVMLFIGFLYVIPLNLLYVLGSRIVKKARPSVQPSV